MNRYDKDASGCYIEYTEHPRRIRCMRDWWNDPPDEGESPQCPKCNEGAGEIITLYGADGDAGQCFQCDECGYRWPLPEEPPYNEEED